MKTDSFSLNAIARILDISHKRVANLIRLAKERGLV
jgi:DNA-binding transcriptional regulator LsrR (DeoR family)